MSWLNGSNSYLKMGGGKSSNMPRCCLSRRWRKKGGKSPPPNSVIPEPHTRSLLHADLIVANAAYALLPTS